MAIGLKGRAVIRIQTLIVLLALFPANAMADWRTDLGTFRIGIVGGSDTTVRLARAEPFRLAVQDALGMPVELFPSPDLASLVSSHADGRLEYAVLTSTAYAAAWKICECVEPLAVAKMADGTQSYRSTIIVRRDSGIGSPQELEGRRVLGLSRDSIGGNAFALFELSADGVNLRKQAAAIDFAANSEDALTRFLGGEADALIGWSSFTGDPSEGYSDGTLRQLAIANGGSLRDYRSIWQSSPIPHRTHSIRKNLAAEAKTILRNMLARLYEDDPVAYDSIEPVYGGGFSVARQGMFDALVSFVGDPLAENMAVVDNAVTGTAIEPQKEEQPASQ